jgi:pilus assembly protein CpaC
LLLTPQPLLITRFIEKEIKVDKNKLAMATWAFTIIATFYFAGQTLDAPTVAPAKPLSQPATLQKPCTSVMVESPTSVVLGKSTVIKLNMPASRLVVGGMSGSSGRAGKLADADSKAPTMPMETRDGVADLDIVLLGPTELFFLGKKAGSMNVVLQSTDGRCTVMDLIVTVDPAPLQAQLAALMPEETGIKIKGVQNSLVLTGSISDAIKLDQAISLATSYGDGKRVVNLLRVTAPQQVMLEVKIAEVSKTLIDRLGSSVSLKRTGSGGDNVFSMLSNFLSKGGGLIEALRIGKTAVNIDGQKDDGLVRVLAEPNIMAISGQSASFLSGGKIFIPTASSNQNGAQTITLTEKEFGISVQFKPTVLDGSRINLKLVSEVSDLSQTGSPFSTVNGVVSVIPSLSVRRADTTVQLNDGQSFVIAGLIKNNSTEAIKRFPGLGEIPVLGALFRSSEFQKDQTELMFVITPRLVKPLEEVPTLPTANHVGPSRAMVYLNGSVEAAAATPETNVSNPSK